MDESTKPRVTVFLLDDEPLITAGIRRHLERAEGFQILGEAHTAEEGLEAIIRLRPNIAVLDVRLPDGDGVEICREIRSRCPEVRCLFLTSYQDDEAMVRAILAGAAGFLFKLTTSANLVDSLRAVAVGHSLLDPTATARVLDRLARDSQESDRTDGLTERESEVLGLIAEGLSNRDIAGRLYLAEKTVKSHVSNLLKKLGLGSRTQAALYSVRRSGPDGTTAAPAAPEDMPGATFPSDSADDLAGSQVSRVVE